MAKSANQKMKLLYLMRILLEKTDETHPMSVPEMITELSRYDISAERKSIYDDIESLRVFGIDVMQVKGKNGGYYIGEPEASEDGSCTIEITLCDYDFSALYNECAEDFAASGVMELPCISPEAVSESGASYFYYGYNTSYLNEYGEKQQLYYIWTQMDSPYTDGYIRTMDRYEERLPEGTEEDPRWRYFLLLDKNREPIGYTLACSGIGIAAQEEVATTVWDGGVASGFGGGSGTAKDPYRIESAQQLAYLAKIVNSSENGIGSHFTLEQDIDLNGREWTPIGSDWNFRGTFDGKGHTVRGLKVTGGIERNYDGDRLEIYAGLFGHVGGGTIKNLTVDGEIFIGIPDREGDSSLYVGGIAGNASQGKVINCHNLCDIEAWNIGSEGLWDRPLRIGLRYSDGSKQIVK